MNTNKPYLMILLFIIMYALQSLAQTADTNLYYGLLHAHTLFSDGSGTPEEAYRQAKTAGLHFFAITEHNHDQAERGADKDRKDTILIAKNHALYNGTNMITIKYKLNGQSFTRQVKSLIKAAEDATTPNFLALYGQEFSTISSGNHMNVINIKDVLEIPNGDFNLLYETIQAKNDNSIILQMNHPDVHADMFGKNANNNDYGIDEEILGDSFNELVINSDKYIQLIEILSGPAMAKTSSQRYHYPKVHEDDYYFYLKQGFHIAPSAGQDNHYPTWGQSSGARIGVYASALTKDAITDAIRKYRCFATEDKNLRVLFSINGSPMGSMISAPADTRLKIEIKIADTDDPSPVYEIELYGDPVEPKSYTQAPKLDAEDGLMDERTLIGNGTLLIDSIVSSGDAQFYYIKVIERDGDRAWSAPIWINHMEAGVSIDSSNTTATMFFWTRNPSSRVYHIEGCTSIKTISSVNLMSGIIPPEGRRQHECHVMEEDDH